jgi:hypothetical protein
MKARQTLGNNVIVKMDPENKFLETPSGLKLYVDTSFEPDKHVVRIGTVEQLPTRLLYKEKQTGFPWKTEMELKVGDRVVMYFLAVQNCLAPEKKNYIRDGEDLWIIIKYHNIYAIIGDGFVKPINGYVFVEPVEDPAWILRQEQHKRLGLELVDTRKLSKTDVTYGKIAYMGIPVEEYADDYKSDKHYNLNIGDTVVMKRIRDIPVEYEYHAKIDGGRKLFRMKRHDILATL